MAESMTDFVQHLAPPAPEKESLTIEDVLLLTKFGPEKAERLFVYFDTHPVQDEAASAKAGRPIFEDVEYIRIQIPGDNGNVVHRPVRWCGSKSACTVRENQDACDLHRFGRTYAAWKGNLSQDAASGTPLSAWSIMTKAVIEELKYFRVHTVEQLANVPDAYAGKLGPGYTRLRQQARDFLESAAGNAPMTRLRSELEQSQEQIKALQQANKDLGDRMEKLMRRLEDAPPAMAAAAPQHEQRGKR